VWNLAVARTVARTDAAAAQRAARVGAAVRTAAGGHACIVFASDDYPQIGFSARCAAAPSTTSGVAGEATRSLARGIDVFVAVEAPSRAPDLDGLAVERRELPGGWTLLRVSPRR